MKRLMKELPGVEKQTGARRIGTAVINKVESRSRKGRWVRSINVVSLLFRLSFIWRVIILS